jgi:hypothetical protein
MRMMMEKSGCVCGRMAGFQPTRRVLLAPDETTGTTIIRMDKATRMRKKGGDEDKNETTKEQVRLRRQVSAIKAVITRG